MSRPPYQLLLVEPDPVFRLGLRVALENLPDCQVAAEAEQEQEALQALASAPTAIDLMILELYLTRAQPNGAAGLALCQAVRTQYPQIPILLLTTAMEPTSLFAAQQLGVAGYCLKGTSLSTLAVVIRQVIAGQTCWPPALPRVEATSELGTLASWRPLATLREKTRRYGLRQIEAALAEVTTQLQGQPSLLDRTILAGRHRELRTAHWLVNQLLAAASPVQELRSSPSPTLSVVPPAPPVPALALPRSISDSSRQGTLQPSSLESVLLDATVIKLQSGLQNLTPTVLEIELLREDKRRELLYLVLRKIEDILSELRFSQIQVDQVGMKRDRLVRDLWQAVLTDFFGKYYTVQLLSGQQVEVVKTLLQDQVGGAAAILNAIPLVPELLAHLLFHTPLLVDNQTCEAGSPEAMLRSEALLQNLMIQVANAVMQPLLNHFADVEAIKQGFYDRRLISTRDIERFRNHLSWKYRLYQYVGEPKAIFESQYPLLILAEVGIKQMMIYAPRRQELDQLSGLQYTVTLVLEARDAIAPRLQSAFSFLGTGLVYVLTEVIGRGIGLIGRGVLQGIGNIWQENRFDRSSNRRF